jgi:SAM-dependent methyltransferase
MLANRPPMPPMEFRKLIGPTADEAFENPSGDAVFREQLPKDCDTDRIYRRVFDFGCGCGRQARQFMLQSKPPEHYVGIDISRDMIAWCKRHLTPCNPHFRFQHHDVFSLTYAPENSKRRTRPLEFEDGSFTLVNAHSVFTHLYEDQATHYLREITRVLDDNGLIRATFFTMNRDWFPVLAPFQHSIFLNEIDPTQAVYFDWRWIQNLFGECGLRIAAVHWPKTKGFQFPIILTKIKDAGRDPLDVWPEPGTVPGF